MYCSRKPNVNELSMAMMAWIVLKENAETENLDPPPFPQLTQQLGICWCVIRGVCVCVSEAMGHGADNTQITILVYSSALSAPQMAGIAAAELTKPLWKMILNSMWLVTEWPARELCGFI